MKQPKPLSAKDEKELDDDFAFFANPCVKYQKTPLKPVHENKKLVNEIKELFDE